jgi:hypothetical protein
MYYVTEYTILNPVWQKHVHVQINTKGKKYLSYL